MGSIVNLERALTLATRLSGHLVQGHVDGVAQISQIQPRGESFEVCFQLPLELAPYCVVKGSIAFDGISLTINQITRRDRQIEISVMIIPHTWNHTRLHTLKLGDSVNVEVDVMAKYVAQNLLSWLAEFRTQLAPPSGKSTL